MRALFREWLSYRLFHLALRLNPDIGPAAIHACREILRKDRP